MKICRFGKCYSYEKEHKAKTMISYIQKVLKEPSIGIFNHDGVSALIKQEISTHIIDENGMKHCLVFAYFGSALPSSSIYADEVEEYRDAAKMLQQQLRF